MISAPAQTAVPWGQVCALADVRFFSSQPPFWRTAASPSEKIDALSYWAGTTIVPF